MDMQQYSKIDLGFSQVEYIENGVPVTRKVVNVPPFLLIKENYSMFKGLLPVIKEYLYNPEEK